MTETKPGERYEVVPNMAALAPDSIPPDGNGQNPIEPTIDEQSKQLAMARMMLDNQKRQREQACNTEIDAALTAILKKHKCIVKFVEQRESYPSPDGQQTTRSRSWLQSVALDEPAQG